MNTITVVGSINLDRTIRVHRMPAPGETVHASGVFSAGGGKGANQAVAARRSGAAVNFIGAVGWDSAGEHMRDLLEREGIDTAGVLTLEDQNTGQAYIVVDDGGENSIMIHGGANQAIPAEQPHVCANAITASDFVIAQLETNIQPVVEAFTLARRSGATTILNPAPALERVPDELLAVTDVIVPNETEAQVITGIDVVDDESLARAAGRLHELGVQGAIITLGHRGAYYHRDDGESGLVPAFPVEAVDTTAAGDTFIGAMASRLRPDLSNLAEAIRYGNKASSLTVQRYGAQPSIPRAAEIE
ncbi:ribokinase [Olsenella sp. YH-ols2217]|uniref:Ribokinase n=1 Tax=Kribbibacterium absianum TaxID=3044210 RepID=A0ABT6ZL49_9ACTN|nr:MULTISPECIES: ribokinase [unclassified Olsenella]MDJ1121762.1 ribokinase [Olsenella sp. YH-ols2216]MDJ1129770.1 ribokinase [Olsenella sp. YH-ols2217]